jgi:hypothetical protein
MLELVPTGGAFACSVGTVPVDRARNFQRHFLLAPMATQPARFSQNLAHPIPAVGLNNGVDHSAPSRETTVLESRSQSGGNMQSVEREIIERQWFRRLATILMIGMICVGAVPLVKNALFPVQRTNR